MFLASFVIERLHASFVIELFEDHSSQPLYDVKLDSDYTCEVCDHMLVEADTPIRFVFVRPQKIRAVLQASCSRNVHKLKPFNH